MDARVSTPHAHAVPFALGVLAGIVHAAAGPDHVAGVAPLAVGAGRRGWRVGLAWGLGHGAGALLAALAAFGLRELVPQAAERISAASELLVGLALVAIGALGLRASAASLGVGLVWIAHLA